MGMSNRFIKKLIVTLFLLHISVYASASKNVLLIHSYHEGHYWTDNLISGFKDSFGQSNDVLLFHEFLDAKRYPKGDFRDLFINYIRDKFDTTELDAIVVSDDTAMSLIKDIRSDFFPQVPLVFMGVNRVTQDVLDMHNTTGIFENRNIGKTVLDIKKITGKDEIIVITDHSAAGQANRSKVEAIKNDSNAPAKIHYVEDVIDTQVVETFERFDSDIPILKIGQIISAQNNNRLLGWNQGAEVVSNWLENPLFTIGITTLKHGAVGADNLAAQHHGFRTAELVKRILDGTPVADIPAITNAESQWTFNWLLLKKHRWDQSKLPEDSLFLNKEESFYQKYKLMVWIIGSAFVVATLLIILMAEIIRRGSHNRALLAENEARYRDLAHAGASIFWETDSGQCFNYVSGDTKVAFGLVPNEMRGKTLIEICKSNPSFDIPWSKYERAIIEHDPISNLVFRYQQHKNELRVLMMNAKPIYDQRKQFIGYRGIIKEITEEHTLSNQLAYQAAYDSLTGLINRKTFNDRLRDYVNQYHSPDEKAFVCFLDLDRFKLVNDTAGHLIGDSMLTEVATVIEKCIGKKDILGRLGGDEFGLIIKGQNRTTARSICEEIITNVTHYRFHWNRRYFNVSVSIGVVPIDDTLNETELLSKADLSCYKAKEAGRGRVYFADLSDSDLYAEELQMGYIANVTQVIEQDQFYLAKQVIAPTEKPSVSDAHVEILIRYRDEQGKTVPPGLFIPAAEKHGVITMIDQWVLKAVFSRYYRYFPEGKTRVSINLSGISLSNQEFVNEIITLVKSSNINPENICFEITETAVISQLSQALDFMHEMKAIGIKFALDDFGSGASSFGYLKSLPVDYLKIDGSLVKNLASEPTDRAIVSSINAIAHMMKMQTIAEFVENEEIRVILQDIGVDYVQGYGIGKPEDC